MHEIVTLQLGEQANYLGTHFWNIQESYFTYDDRQESPIDHDVHFRSGLAAEGSDTYTPRTLIYDSKKSFGTLKKINELYQIFDEHAEGQRPPNSTHRLPPVPPHPYQRALNAGSETPALTADSIRYWSDYNRVFFHPKSIVQVYEDELNPQQRAFNSWQDGEDLFESICRESDPVDDELRPLIEDCDQMQGVQLLTSVDDGWGGFASKYLERMRDEYGKSSVVVWALNVLDPADVSKRTLSRANQARSLHQLSEHSSLYIPLTAAPSHIPDVLDFKSQHPWCTSAVQVTALETMLLPTRLKAVSGNSWTRLDDMVLAYSAEPNQKVAQMDLEVLDVLGRQTHVNGTNGVDGSHAQVHNLCQFFPIGNSATDEDHRTQVTAETVRTIIDDEDDAQGQRPANDTASRYRTDLAFPIIDSFPPPYGSHDRARPHGLRTKTSLYKSNTVASWARGLGTIVRRQGRLDEREELLDGLEQIATAYHRKESDDDFDDD